ncbi:MAG: serine hydrolase domain-containing protein, partial [Spirochaetota bacterium]
AAGKVRYTLFILLVCSCSTVPPTQLQYTPYTPEETWRTSSPAQQGLDTAYIDGLIHTIRTRKIDVHNLTVIKNGHCVAQVDFAPYSGESLHDIASCTKSVMAVLTGIAIDKGYIHSEEATVADIIRDRRIADNPAFRELQIRHLLSMSSGLECINTVSDEHPFAETTLLEMMHSDNWYAYIAAMDRTDTPGKRFDYFSINFHLLSMLIRDASGMPAVEFARIHLFEPLGITEYAWAADPHGNSYGWGNLMLKPLDLARIGYLVKNRGRWGGRQVVSQHWIDEMLTEKVSGGWNPVFHMDYGYGFFLPSGIRNGFYAGLGRGGQYLFIFPKEDMVIVTLGNFNNTDFFLGLTDVDTTQTRDRAGSSGPVRRTVPYSTEIPSRNGAGLDAWHALSGRWVPRGEDVLGIEYVEFLPGDGSVYIHVESNVLSVAGYASMDGAAYTHDRGGIAGTVITSARSTDDGLEIVMNEIENINTFHITVSGLENLQDRGSVEVMLYEHLLLPRGYTFRMKKEHTDGD